MGMFGRRRQSYEDAGIAPPGVGARVLNQIGMNLLGVDFERQRLRDAIAGKQREFMDDFTGRLGPQYEEGPAINVGLDPAESNASTWEYEAPRKVSDGLSIMSPELPALAARAQRLGVPLNSILDVLKAQAPEVEVGPGGEAYNKKDPGVVGRVFRDPTNINGWVVDRNKRENEGQYFPGLPSGVIPDGRGGVSNATGLVPALGAQEEAQARGRTLGTMYTIPRSGGGTGLMTGRQYLGGGEGGAGAQQQGFGLSQTPDDAAYASETAKASAGQFNAIQSAGQRAAGLISTYQRIDQLLNGLNTGRFAPAGKELNSALASLGIQGNSAWSNIEAADALSKKLALDAMGGSLGAGFSNADRDFVLSMNPSIMNTPQGRDAMVKFGVARAKREQQVAQMARQWNQRAGRLDKPDRNGRTFYDYLDAWAEANPLMKGR